VEIVVERSCQVFANDALPLSFPVPKISLVFFEVVHQFEADVFFEHGFGFFDFLSDVLGGFCMRGGLLRTMSLTFWSFMSLCLILKSGRSASGSFTSSSYSYSAMLVIYFENNMNLLMDYLDK